MAWSWVSARVAELALDGLASLTYGMSASLRGSRRFVIASRVATPLARQVCALAGDSRSRTYIRVSPASSRTAGSVRRPRHQQLLSNIEARPVFPGAGVLLWFIAGPFASLSLNMTLSSPLIPSRVISLEVPSSAQAFMGRPRGNQLASGTVHTLQATCVAATFCSITRRQAQIPASTPWPPTDMSSDRSSLVFNRVSRYRSCLRRSEENYQRADLSACIHGRRLEAFSCSLSLQ